MPLLLYQHTLMSSPSALEGVPDLQNFQLVGVPGVCLHRHRVSHMVSQGPARSGVDGDDVVEGVCPDRGDQGVGVLLVVIGQIDPDLLVDADLASSAVSSTISAVRSTGPDTGCGCCSGCSPALPRSTQSSRSGRPGLLPRQRPLSAWGAAPPFHLDFLLDLLHVALSDAVPFVSPLLSRTLEPPFYHQAETLQRPWAGRIIELTAGTGRVRGNSGRRWARHQRYEEIL